MYVNIGGDVILSDKDIVAILNAKQMDQSPINVQLLKDTRHNSKLVTTIESEPRTYIITRSQIYTSHVSVRTIEKRSRSTWNLSSKIMSGGETFV